MSLTAKEKSIRFVGNFLKWYQNSFGQSDVYNHIKLMDLVKEAEDIHTQKVKQFDYYVDGHGDVFEVAKKVNPKQPKKRKHKKISRYF